MIWFLLCLSIETEASQSTYTSALSISGQSNIINCMFLYCRNSGDGGAISGSGTSVTIDGCLFNGCYSGSWGGNIYLSSFANLTIIKTCMLNFSNNAAKAGKSNVVFNGNEIVMDLTTVHSSFASPSYEIFCHQAKTTIYTNLNLSRLVSSTRGGIILAYSSNTNFVGKNIHFAHNKNNYMIFNEIGTSHTITQNNLINNTVTYLFYITRTNVITNCYFYDNKGTVSTAQSTLTDCFYDIPTGSMMYLYNTYLCQNPYTFPPRASADTRIRFSARTYVIFVLGSILQ